jgi:hypothetical protein
MNGLETSSEMEAMLDRYLGELATALKRLPTVRRDQLISDIREHIAQLRAERPPVDRADMEALLNRVGLPEDIAEVALEGQDPDGDEPQLPRPPVVVPVRSTRLTGKVALITATCVVVVGLLSFIALSGGTSSRALFRQSAIPFVVRPQVRHIVQVGPPVFLGPLTVPNVLGMSPAEAMAALADAGFRASMVSKPSSSVPAGQVSSESPASGSLLAKGSLVTLSVSSGPAT